MLHVPACSKTGHRIVSNGTIMWGPPDEWLLQDFNVDHNKISDNWCDVLHSSVSEAGCVSFVSSVCLLFPTFGEWVHCSQDGEAVNGLPRRKDL